MSNNILYNIFNYKELHNNYKNNKDKQWNSWLKYVSNIKTSGKQGIVGIFKDKNTEKKILYKFSQYINHLVKHEYCVMLGLNDIAHFCPHFCKAIGVIKANIEPTVKKEDNPYKIKSKYPIKKDILLMEYLENCKKLSSYIKSKNFPEYKIYSCIKQVLMAINIAQKKKSFTHYDLHSDNILLKKCNKDMVFLYVLDENNQFLIPTNGYYPQIIDFGFSYIKDMEDEPLWPSMAHTDVGFMSDRFDSISDPKLFLVTISDELKKYRASKQSKNFRKIIKNIFHPLTINWEAGWDKIDKMGALDYVSEITYDLNKISPLFDKYHHYCLDILQTMIILPLENQDYTDIKVSFSSFLHEFSKIESEILEPYYKLYILKSIIDYARIIRPYYLDINTRQKAMKLFRENIYEKINSISKFCRLKDLKYEKMLCSLYVFSSCMEGVLYEAVNNKWSLKQKEYNKMPINTIEQIYATIDINIPDNYVYNENTGFLIFDCITEKTIPFKLTNNELQQLNDIHPISQGGWLYKKYKKI